MAIFAFIGFVCFLVVAFIISIYAAAVSFSVAFPLSTEFGLPGIWEIANLLNAVVCAPLVLGSMLHNGSLIEFLRFAIERLGPYVGGLAVFTAIPALVGLASSLLFYFAYSFFD
jgi:hypothetical protein